MENDSENADASPSSEFHFPAYKLMISDLQEAKINSEGIWQLDLRAGIKSQSISLRMIWLQGLVSNIGDNEFVLSDSITNCATIEDFSCVAGGSHTALTEDAYVGVIGTLLFNYPEVRVKAIKVMYLNDNPVLKTMWANEVKILKYFMLEAFNPEL